MGDNVEQNEERYIEELYQFYVDIPEDDPPWWIDG